MVLRREDVQDSWLREYSFGGWGYSHLIPFWEGPFESFLYIDADCVVLGDIVAAVKGQAPEIIIPGDGGVITDEAIIGEHWFDCQQVRRLLPAFEPTGWPFFCAGTFMGKRGALDLDLYKRLHRIQKDDSSATSFKYGDQGILNCLMFHAASEEKVGIRTKDFQKFPATMDADERANALRILNGESQEAVVLHYAHVKPTVFHERGGSLDWLHRRLLPGEIFPEPMNHFRRLVMQENHEWSDVRLWVEDAPLLYQSVVSAIARNLLKAKSSRAT